MKVRIMNRVLEANGAKRVLTHTYQSTIESVDSISRDEPDAPLTQYITNAVITRARYNITHFKHHHRVLQLISNRISV